MDYRLLLTSLLAMASGIAGAQSPYLVDWDEAGHESIEHLVNLVRIDTSNPPGNETEVVRYLEKQLAAEGIESAVCAHHGDRRHRYGPGQGQGDEGLRHWAGQIY